MTIFKFGGSNFNSKESFDNFLKIVNEIKSPTLIVVSALGKTTRRLDESLHLAETGKLTESLDISEKLKNFTLNLIDLILASEEVKNQCTENINNIFDEIANYLRNIYVVRELTAKTRDKVLAYGEKISSQIFFSFLLDNEVSFEQINADEIIITDNSFGKANPINEKIEQNIATNVQSTFEKSNIILTQGFIGCSEDGDTTTMGFESSNLTALLFAQYLDAKEITIWTDVEGVYNIDPNIYPNANPIAKLSYFQAKLAAKYGNKLFYHKMIKFAKEHRISVYFRSLFNPNGNTTLISDNHKAKENMLIYLDQLFSFKLDLSENNPINQSIFSELLKQDDSTKFVIRYNSESYVFTDDNAILNIIGNELEYERLSGVVLLNPNILKIYKTITDFSDLFINLDFRLYPIENNIFLLLIRKSNNRDINNLLKILLNK